MTFDDIFSGIWTEAAFCVMAFAKEYRAEITLAYYCLNIALTVTVFVFGTIYLRYRDRRDQQRKEWRHFAETIRSQYRKLKAENIPWKISKVKDTFENIQVYEGITGIDVLRFMINDPNHDKCFETIELDALLEDLDSIYQLLNTCASLILLGKVPKNIRAELRELVTKLGELALPFYKGEERYNILKCLKHFGRHFDREKINDQEVNWRNIDGRITEDVQYVRCLRFGSANLFHFQPSLSVKSRDRERRGYGTCSKFKFEFDSAHIGNNQQLFGTIDFLDRLHDDLERPAYTKDFADKLREHAPDLEFIVKIARNDSDGLVLAKVLHEIRNYIYIILEGQGAEALDAERNRNIDTLRDVHEIVTRFPPRDEVVVRTFCKQFMNDLSFLHESTKPYHKSSDFRLQFQQLYDTFHHLVFIRNNDGLIWPPPSVETEVNCQHESSV